MRQINFDYYRKRRIPASAWPLINAWLGGEGNETLTLYCSNYRTHPYRPGHDDWGLYTGSARPYRSDRCRAYGRGLAALRRMLGAD